MAAMAALGRRLRALGRGVRGVQTPPRYEESTAEFGFVERLLPPSRIPDPPPAPQIPHPVRLEPPRRPPPGSALFRSSFPPCTTCPCTWGLRQGRRLTELRRIHGDIWAPGAGPEGVLGSLGVPEVAAQVNEVTGDAAAQGALGGLRCGTGCSRGASRDPQVGQGTPDLPGDPKSAGGTLKLQGGP